MFDVQFWQALGDRRIFEAAWDLVVTAAAAKGIPSRELRLQRSVEKLKPLRRALPDQLGVDPVRVDILMDIPGLRFPEAWSRRVETDFLGEPAPMICRGDLRRLLKQPG